MHQQHNVPLGVAWFLLHCLLFTLLSLFTKGLIRDIHVFEIIFFETLFSCLLLLPAAIKMFRAHIAKKALKAHAVRAFLWMLATALYFSSLKHIPLPKAVALSFTVPLFTSLLAVTFAGEKLSFDGTLALIFGFVGMLIVIRPDMAAFEPACLLVIAASLLWSVTDIMVKRMGRTEQHVAAQTFLFALFSVAFTLPLAAANWTTPSPAALLAFLAMGVIFTVNIASVSLAYKNAELTVLMPFAFSQLLFAAVLAYLFFDETASPHTLAGGAVIIGSVSYAAFRRRFRRR
jgi:drug/metabolite transporter (DMT)-like permease